MTTALRRTERVTAVVSDLDGTLLRSDGSLSLATATALRTSRDAGVEVLVATARTPRGVRKIPGYEELGVVVCANGAVVWDARKEEILEEASFDKDALCSAICRLRDGNGELGWAMLTSEVMYADDAYVNARTTGATGLVPVPDVCEIAATKPVVAVAVRHRRLPAAALFETISSGFRACGTASLAGRAVVDVNPLGITKAVAVERVLLAHGHRPQTVVAFGDMPNDLPLFVWAGYSFAVANAHPEVLAAADEVVPRNDQDGVARTLNSLVRHAARDSRPTPPRLGRLGTPTVDESARQ